MALNLSKEKEMYDELYQHIGHRLDVYSYGDLVDPVNITIECVTCGCVLLSADKDPEE